MSSTVRGLIVVGVLGIMFVVLAKLVLSPQKEHLIPATPPEQAAEPILDDDRAPSSSGAVTNLQIGPRSAASSKNGASSNESARKQRLVKLEETLAPRLKRYTEMSSKVFLNAREKTEKAALLRDVNLFKNLASILTEPSTDSRVQEEQNSAIDLLLESSVKDHNPDAQATLLAVIGNESLGNSQQPFDQKELGGIKAEIMYKWSAGDPSVKSSIEANLPDPASQKLWQNVLEIQSENQSESESLGKPGRR